MVMKADPGCSGGNSHTIYCNVYHVTGQIFSVTTYLQL
jgi:hypothetical protein